MQHNPGGSLVLTPNAPMHAHCTTQEPHHVQLLPGTSLSICPHCLASWIPSVFFVVCFFAEAAIMRKLRQARYDTSASWAAEWLGWLPDNPAPHCTWRGISCRDGRVVSM